jgi:hypothetical protein
MTGLPYALVMSYMVMGIYFSMARHHHRLLWLYAWPALVFHEWFGVKCCIPVPRKVAEDVVIGRCIFCGQYHLITNWNDGGAQCYGRLIIDQKGFEKKYDVKLDKLCKGDW